MKSIFRQFIGLFHKRNEARKQDDKRNEARKPTLAVIDDCCMIRSAVRDALCDVYDVTALPVIPNDLSELDAFDALVVDGSGIGNRSYRTGVDFLLAYAPSHPEKRFVHFTGFCERRNMDSLEKIGVPVVTKGVRPGKILEALTQKVETK